MVQSMRIASYVVRLLPVILLSLCLTGCSSGTPPDTGDSNNASADQTPSEIRALQAATSAPSNPVPLYTYDIVNIWPHNVTAYTEGLLFLDGYLFESTGEQGQSTLRRVDLTTGNVLQRVD